MFDTAGTLMGVAQRAGLIKPDGKIENLSKALKADSASSVFGAMVGVPPVTSYVESAAGVAAGGRTGLTAVTVGVLFIAAMFFAPLAGMIPAYATAGALRSEEHTSELQSLMRISYAVFCLKKKTNHNQ